MIKAIANKTCLRDPFGFSGKLCLALVGDFSHPCAGLHIDYLSHNPDGAYFFFGCGCAGCCGCCCC
jgi:hypothetical protein